MKRIAGLAAALGLSILEAGCGGGSSASIVPPPPQPASNYLFYGASGTNAVNRTQPSSRVTLSSSGTYNGVSFYQATYDALTGTLSGIGLNSVLWIDGSGNIYRSGPASLTPVFVANEPAFRAPIVSSSQVICDAYAVMDWSNADLSQYVYSVSKINQDCSAPTVKAVPINAAGTLVPKVAPGKIVDPLRDPSTGALTGWLLNEGADLVRTQIDFTNPVTVQFGAGNVLHFATDSSGNLLLQTGTASALAIRRYDVAAGTLSATGLYSLPNPGIFAIGPVVQDGSNVYFTVENGTTGSLYKLSLSAALANSAVQIAGESSGVFSGPIFLTANKVVYTWQTLAGSTVKTASQSVISSAPGVAIASPVSGATPALFSTSGNLVYLNGPLSSQAAIILDETGTQMFSRSNSQWVGRLFPTQRPIGYSPLPAEYLLAAGLSSTGSFANSTLYTYTAGTSNLVATLGVLASDITRFNNVSNYGPYILMQAGSGGSWDIYYADTDVSASLLRITNTPAVSETLFRTDP